MGIQINSSKNTSAQVSLVEIVSTFNIQVATGKFTNISNVHKFGRNSDIDSAFESIWGGGGDYTGFDAVAAQLVEVFSSDLVDDSVGTGARTVEIFGLDANYNEQNEIVIMDGTTKVDTVNSYIRLHRVVVRTAGTGLKNAGTITVRQKVTVANIFAVMPIGYNQTMIAAYTIPNGKIGYLTKWGAGLSGKVNANSNARFVVRPLGEVFQVKEEFSVQGAGTSYTPIEYVTPKGPYAAKTDIKIEADTDTVNTGIAASFELLLIDE